jgi:hypothetical protein
MVERDDSSSVSAWANHHFAAERANRVSGDSESHTDANCVLRTDEWFEYVVFDFRINSGALVFDYKF